MCITIRHFKKVQANFIVTYIEISSETSLTWKKLLLTVVRSFLALLWPYEFRTCDDISDFEKIDFLVGQAILSVSSPCRSDLMWKFEEKTIFGIRVYGFIRPEILIYGWKWAVIHVFRLKEWFWLHGGAFRFLNFEFEKFLQKMTKKWRKITNLEFEISWPI